MQREPPKSLIRNVYGITSIHGAGGNPERLARFESRPVVGQLPQSCRLFALYDLARYIPSALRLCARRDDSLVFRLI